MQIAGVDGVGMAFQCSIWMEIANGVDLSVELMGLIIAQTAAIWVNNIEHQSKWSHLMEWRVIPISRVKEPDRAYSSGAVSI